MTQVYIKKDNKYFVFSFFHWLFLVGEWDIAKVVEGSFKIQDISKVRVFSIIFVHCQICGYFSNGIGFKIEKKHTKNIEIHSHTLTYIGCIFSLHTFHLLLLSQQASIAMWTILISKSWWWGCRIHWLHLCRGVRRVSWLWHKKFWWWGSSNAGALGNAEYPFIAIPPRSTLTGMVAPDRALSMG